MNTERLKLLIAEGEGLTVEFKEVYTPKIDRDIVALANAKGGFIVLGINDDGKLVGEKLTNQMKAEILSIARNCEPHITISKISQIDNVIIIEVSEGDEKPYSCSSGYFRRLDAVTQKMSQKEVRTIFRQTVDVSFEDLPRKDFGLADISFTKVKIFLEEAKASYKINKANLSQFLSSLSIYKEGNINNAGILMFASEVGRFIPYAEIILGAFKGKDKSHIYDRKDVKDDLMTQLNEAVAFIKKHLNVRSEIHGINRDDIYEIPLDALREALVNAIIHRDYSMRGTSVYVNIFDDRIEIVNPGGLPAGITRDNFGKESVRRNLIVADLFHRMGKVERMGSGIERMRGLMRKSDLREPVFTSDSFFHTVFYRNPEYALKGELTKGSQKSTEKSREKLRRNCGEVAEKVFQVINANLFIKTRDIADQTQLSQRTVDYAILKLKKAGFLKRVGPDRGGHWEIPS